MGKKQCQNETPLVQKEAPADVRHADKQRSGQSEGQRKLAKPGGLGSDQGVALTGEIAKREHKEYSEQCSDESADVHGSLLPSELIGVLPPCHSTCPRIIRDYTADRAHVVR